MARPHWSIVSFLQGRWMRMRFLVGLAIAALVSAACASILGIEPGNPETSGTFPDGGEEGSVDSAPPDPCPHARPPPPPDVDDDPATDLPAFIVAMEALEVTLPKDPTRRLGLDLDKSCT